MGHLDHLKTETNATYTDSHSPGVGTKSTRGIHLLLRRSSAGTRSAFVVHRDRFIGRMGNYDNYHS